ncbi:MAG: hypothetical protein ACPGWS_01365 [Solirubrobacterales bacterium]
MGVTTRQKGVLEYVRGYIAQHRRSPTIREIGDHFGIRSPNGVICHLKALRKKGLLDWTPGISRSILLITDDHCPCCGQRIKNNTTPRA